MHRFWAEQAKPAFGKMDFEEDDFTRALYNRDVEKLREFLASDRAYASKTTVLGLVPYIVLACASPKPDEAIIRLLLENGADHDAPCPALLYTRAAHMTAIRCALDRSEDLVSIVTLLLERGAKVDDKCLEKAIYQSHLESFMNVVVAYRAQHGEEKLKAYFDRKIKTLPIQHILNPDRQNSIDFKCKAIRYILDNVDVDPQGILVAYLSALKVATWQDSHYGEICKILRDHLDSTATAVPPSPEI